MMFDRGTSHIWLLWITALILLPTTGPAPSAAQDQVKAGNTRIWDTQSPGAAEVDVRDRAGWKVVPANLLATEADPAAAMSDPGYYGREYSFKGDAVVENEHLTAVFSSTTAKVVIYRTADPGNRRAEFVPLQLKARPAVISYCRILHNTPDEAALEVSFSAKQTGENLCATFSFSNKPIIEIKPAENMKGVSLLSPMEYVVVPSFIGDDLIFDPGKYPLLNTLHSSCDNLLLGLLKGENSVLVLTWPKGSQQVRLILGSKEQERRLIESVDFDNEGRSIYLAVLDAPGIWHKEEMKASYLEKDTAIDWKRPFPARWKTQLNEAGVRTTYKFAESRQRIWRAVTGFYIYPVWFSGETAFYHLSKKIPPEGESLVYFLEARGTPAFMPAPVDIMKETLGRETCDDILDLAGRKLRSHHRRAGAGIRRACTCGCTEAMQAVFEAGDEVQKAEYLDGALEDMVYFVTRHMERIKEYQDFAHKMMEFLNLARQSNPALKPFLSNMENITQDILQEYDRQRQNIKSPQYVDELARNTRALTQRKDPKNLPAFLELGKKWREMGGAQDDLVAKSHAMTRRLFQEASYGCVDQPQAVKIAQEIRSRCRQCLRNPDGYEIWQDY